MCVYNGDIVARKGFIKETRKLRRQPCVRNMIREETACPEDRTGVCLVRFRNHKEASAGSMD